MATEQPVLNTNNEKVSNVERSRGRYQWRISNIPSSKLLLIIHGFIRETNQNINEEIVDTLIKYCDSIYAVINAKCEQAISSPIFSIASFKWMMVLNPRGNHDSPDFQWFLYLSMPPNIERVNVSLKLKSPELSDNALCDKTVEFEPMNEGCRRWIEDILEEHIKKLQTLTFDLELQVLNIYDEDGNDVFMNRYNQSLYAVPFAVPSMYYHHDIRMDLNNTKLTQTESIYADSFDFKGVKFEVSMNVQPGYTMIFLKILHIPSHIDYLYINAQTRVVETDKCYSQMVRLDEDNNYLIDVYDADLILSDDKLKYGDVFLNELNIRLRLRIVDVFDKEGTTITDQYYSNEDELAYNECKLNEYRSYEWHIPFLSTSRSRLLCEAYVEKQTFLHIPADVIAVIVLLYDEKNIISKIKNAKNRDQFDSDIFLIDGFKMFMEIYPNGINQDSLGQFDWYMTIASMSPSISKIVFGYTAILVETNTTWRCVSALSRETASIGWAEKTQLLSEIQHLDKITMKLSLSVFEVLDKNKKRMDASQYSLFQNPSLRTCADTYEWNIRSITSNIWIKNAKEDENIDSPFFVMFGLKWYLRLYPVFHKKHDGRMMVGLYIRLTSIPPNISAISVKYKLACLETNSEFQVNGEFREGHLSEGWSSNVLSYEELASLETMSFKVDILLVDVYDQNGIAMTEKFMNGYKNIEFDVNEIKEEYEWKINDPNTMKQIYSAKNGDSFCSNIISLHNLKWAMEICPKGDNTKSTTVDWYFHLVSLPSNISKICVHYKVLLKETGTTDCHTTSFRLRHTSYGWGSDHLDHEHLLKLKSITFYLQIFILDIYDLDGNKLNVNSITTSPSLKYASIGTFEWKITDKDAINMMMRAESGEKFQSEYFSVGTMGNFFLYFCPNGTDKENEGCSELFFSIKVLPKNVKSISFYFELELDETKTKYTNYLHFKDDFLSKGWTPHKITIDELKELNSFTFRCLVRLIDIYSDNDYNITSKYTQL